MIYTYSRVYAFSRQDIDNFCLLSLVFDNSGCDSETSST